MSLKGFHIVFITFSTLLALGCSAWCLSIYQAFGATVYIVGAVVSGAVAIGLLTYGVWFYRKMKRLRLIT